MSSLLPSSTLADRFAGLSGDVGRDAEEAWLLKRMVLEWLAQMLAMLAGLAAQFAAGTLPLLQAARFAPSAPPRSGSMAAGARRPGYARGSADNIQGEVATEVFAPGTCASNQAALGATCASNPGGLSRDVGRPPHSFRLDLGTLRRIGILRKNGYPDNPSSHDNIITLSKQKRTLAVMACLPQGRSRVDSARAVLRNDGRLLAFCMQNRRPP